MSRTGKTKSILDWSIIRLGRVTGNSTRQIDRAIDLFFQGHTVLVEDHYMQGEHREANKLLMKRIVNRLEAEHPRAKYKVNLQPLTIHQLWD